MGALAVEIKLCPQCYLPKPIVDFVRRSGDGLARTCARCRKRYSNWSTKTLTEKLVGMPPRVGRCADGTRPLGASFAQPEARRHPGVVE